MAATVFSPITGTESSPSDDNTNGSGGGGPSGPNGSGRDTAEREPERSATLPGAYPLVAAIVMIWITALFGAVTIVLESRWAHSPNWVSIRFPRILYVDAAILVRSSLSIEVARRSLQRGRADAAFAGSSSAYGWASRFSSARHLHGMSCLCEVCISMRTRGAFSCIW